MTTSGSCELKTYRWGSAAWPPLAIGVLMLALGCEGRGSDGGEGVVVRDSAGVELVESLGSRWSDGEGWTLSHERPVEIGLEDGAPEFLFASIEAARFLPDGTIAVADRGSSDVRLFSQSGEFLSRIGGPGDGPGELGWVRDLGLCGADSLYVFEADWLTVVYDRSGDYVREARPYIVGDRERNPYALRCAPNGHYVGVGWEEPGLQAQGFYRAEAGMWILSPITGSLPSDAEAFRDAGLYVSAELPRVLSSERIGDGQGGSGPHPFGRKATFAISQDAVYVGTGESFEIRRYGLDGVLERIIRWPGEDLIIERAHLESYRDPEQDVRPDLSDEFWERQQQELLANAFPPAFPTFHRLEVDPFGNVWAERFPQPGAETHSWLVFDTNGVLLGSVDIPLGFRVMDIGRDGILGVMHDGLGVQRLRLYSLVRP